MAYMITVDVLVDRDNELSAENQVTLALQKSLEKSIVDFTTKQVVMANPVLNEMVADKKHSFGDLSEQEWLIFSPKKNDIFWSGYWSDEYGWTQEKFADVYDGKSKKMPYGVDDAVWVMRRKAK